MADVEIHQSEEQAGGAGEVEELIDAFSHDDGIARQRASLKLARMGAGAVHRLIEAVEHPHHQVRWEAARTLARIGDPRSTHALIKALQDKDYAVRWVAAEGLARIGDEAVVPLVQALIHHVDSQWMREGAHHVLHDLLDKPYGPVLKPVVDALWEAEPIQRVPGKAYAALRELGVAKTGHDGGA